MTALKTCFSRFISISYLMLSISIFISVNTAQAATSYNIPPYLQKLLPHQLINYLAYSLAEKEWPWLKNHLISEFITRNNIDMSEALYESPENYRSFNDFFTRPLKIGARCFPENSQLITSPVDGTISQIGQIANDRIIQAKRHDYSLTALLAGNSDLAKRFSDGLFSTIYLSPADYHRVHMPVAGTLKQMIYVPGSLYSVNSKTTDSIQGLHALNERVISIFDTEYGEMAVIMIGAMVVGSMETAWAGQVKPWSRQVTWRFYDNISIHLKRGEEMGLFKLGSTVILLFANPDVNWLDNHHPGYKIKMGEALGELFN